MTVLQAVLIALFVYLASIGSVIGNTLGWYNLGRPLVASLIVGIIMGNVPVALQMGILLQLAGMGSVTPGGAVAWDYSYAAYIGIAGGIAFGGDMATMWAFSIVGGALGVAMWNLVYVLDLSCNRVAYNGAVQDNPRKIAFANAGLGNLIGFVCRAIPAFLILYSTVVLGSQNGINVAELIPAWLTTILTTFGGMMAALGMGILLSMLLKKATHFCIFLIGFMLVTYFGLNMMAIAMLGIVVAVIYYYILVSKDENKLQGGLK